MDVKTIPMNHSEIKEIVDTLDTLKGNIRADAYKKCIEEGAV